MILFCLFCFLFYFIAIWPSNDKFLQALERDDVEIRLKSAQPRNRAGNT